MSAGDDPRIIADSIARKGTILNETQGQTVITSLDMQQVLRNVVEPFQPYREAIKQVDRENKNKICSYDQLKNALANEYLNYQKQPNINVSNAFKSQLVNNDHDRIHVYHDNSCDHDNSHESLYWVDVPKGHCIQYAIKGICTRENCEFKHVKGVNNKSNNLTSFQKSSVSHKTNNKQHNDRTSFKKKFNNNKKKFIANVVNLLDNEVSGDESSSSHSDPDTDVSSDDDLNDLVSALKARFYKPKSGNKTKKQATFIKNHPNKTCFSEKMDDLKTKDKKNRKNKKKLDKKSLKANLGELLTTREFQLAMENLSDNESE